MVEVALADPVKVPVVLFFDSGVGGLSVFAEVQKLNPECAYYYLFDHECFPYGIRSEVFLRKRVKELIQRASAMMQPDLIVIACNTASTAVLPTLREAFSVPIVGVVPAIKPAAACSHKKKIALLATPGTVKRAYTDFLINEFAEDCQVLRIGSDALVRLAENSLGTGLTAEGQCTLEHVLEPLTALEPAERPDVVVLGCTHFPLLKKEIGAILGPEVRLVDSGEAVARRVQALLKEMKSIHHRSCAQSYEKERWQREDSVVVKAPGPCVAFYVGKMKDEEEAHLFKKSCAFFGFEYLMELTPHVVAFD